MSGKKKEIRSKFRNAVFTRDRYRCAFCGVPGRDRQGGEGHRKYHANFPEAKLVLLDAHHITDRHALPNGGYVVENGISLCDDGCHLLAEEYHRSSIAPPGFSPAELYSLIGSSREAAVRACS